jgi:hypothetical protein
VPKSWREHLALYGPAPQPEKRTWYLLAFLSREGESTGAEMGGNLAVLRREGEEIISGSYMVSGEGENKSEHRRDSNRVQKKSRINSQGLPTQYRCSQKRPC